MKFEFSNFEPCKIFLDGVPWPSVEHYYQAQKTFDLKSQERIRKLESAKDAKKAGKNLVVRPDWERVKESIMYDALQEKFKQGVFRNRLLNTGEQDIVEWNTWHDNYWGNCLCVNCEKIKGQNRLGKLLMKIRSELKNQLQDES